MKYLIMLILAFPSLASAAHICEGDFKIATRKVLKGKGIEYNGTEWITTCPDKISVKLVKVNPQGQSLSFKSANSVSNLDDIDGRDPLFFYDVQPAISSLGFNFNSKENGVKLQGSMTSNSADAILVEKVLLFTKRYEEVHTNCSSAGMTTRNIYHDRANDQDVVCTYNRAK